MNARAQPNMLAATRCLLAWRYHEAIGSHSSTADFELTVLPAAAGAILVALLEESKSNEALSPYHKDRLYRGVSFGNPLIIHEIVEDLDEEKLLLAWTLIEVIARLDAATQPRATVSMLWKISTPNLRAISCVGERALAQSLSEHFSLTPKWSSRVVGALIGHKTGWGRVEALLQVLTPRATVIARELCECEQFPYHFFWPW